MGSRKPLTWPVSVSQPSGLQLSSFKAAQQDPAMVVGCDTKVAHNLATMHLLKPPGKIPKKGRRRLDPRFVALGDARRHRGPWRVVDAPPESLWPWRVVSRHGRARRVLTRAVARHSFRSSGMVGKKRSKRSV